MYGDTKSFPLEGYKGYVVGGNVTLAPNMVADVEWYDLKGKKLVSIHGPFGPC